MMNNILYAQEYASFEIKEVKFTVVKDIKLKKAGHNYAILVRIESDSIQILQKEGREWREEIPFEFLVVTENNKNTVRITKKKNAFDYTDKFEDNPLKVKFFLLGPFDPGIKNVLKILWRGNAKSVEIPVFEELQNEFSKDEKIDSYIANNFDLDFNINTITNLPNEFSSDFHFRLDKISVLGFNVDGTVSTSDSVKNGFKINLDVLSGNGLLKQSLGRIFGEQYYYYKIDGGFYLETDQHWKTKKLYLKINPIIEIPFTNLFSLNVHKEYNMLRTAPGLIASISYLHSIDKRESGEFAKNKRFDIGAWYSITLNPVLFAKLKVNWFYDPDKKKWKRYQEHRIGIKMADKGNSYYYFKYIKGFNPPDFTNTIDEYLIGVATDF